MTVYLQLSLGGLAEPRLTVVDLSTQKGVSRGDRPLAHQDSDGRENGELECALGLVPRLRDGGNVCEHEDFAAATQAGSKQARDR